ncbi:MAG: hypothetical protein NT011_08965 [Kiritimatiellaeota bacterium]|nr:hypothetical protein [Kiritimatiellota bacterium]
MTTYKTIVIILLAAVALSLSATAKVFWTRPAARGHAVLETTPDWKTVYTSSVRINDGQGDLTIIGCNEPLGAVMTKLRQAYASCKTLSNFRQNETLGWARLREGGAIVTLLALAPNLAMAPNTPEQTMLFVLTQTPGNFDKSRGPPTAPCLRDPSPYPGSRVQTYLTSEESQMQLEIYVATARPEAVQQYYESTLLSQAWTRLDPAGASASLTIYQKGTALCALLVLPSGTGSESTITVLHKLLKTE